MVKDATAVVHNFRPGVMERLGLGEEALRARNPSVILCAVSGYGESGPYQDYPAYDLPIQALSGLVGVTGEPGGPPIKPGISLSDEVAGLYAALALCAAIAQRNASGVGDYLEVPLLDCSIAMLTYLGANYLSAGVIPGPIGTHHPSVAPWGCYRTRDGHIAIAIWGEAFWRSLCEIVGKEWLLTDPRFATNGDRVSNRTALEEILHSSFGEAPTEVWLERLRSAGVPSAPVNTLDQTFSDPQVVSRDLVLTLPTPSGKGMKVVGNPIRGRGVRRRILPAPELDEFTERRS
jgi:crotonobetainyl-CoA:carnitine CoA-transferase CaiB-like acyl-CoA transferase